MSLWAATKEWMHAPFKQPMDIWHLILVVIIVTIIVFLWLRVLAHFGHLIPLSQGA